MKVKNLNSSEVIITTLEGKGYRIEGKKSLEVPGTIHPYYFKNNVVEIVETKTIKTKESDE